MVKLLTHLNLKDKLNINVYGTSWLALNLALFFFGQEAVYFSRLP